jgi:hypothetical protein
MDVSSLRIMVLLLPNPERYRPHPALRVIPQREKGKFKSMSLVHSSLLVGEIGGTP